jgi:L-malate glycosyltransferase
MKILILGDASNPHIIKWANALYSSSVKIYIFSLREANPKSFKNGIEIIIYNSVQKFTYLTNAAFSKLLYLKSVPRIRKIIKDIRPDIVHAHYASSYGLLGALTNFHPMVISVWGGDVIDFPVTSIFHRIIFQFIIRRADRLLTTSHFMADMLKKYYKKNIEITPFGIDITLFTPGIKFPLFDEEFDAIIGCIKGLEWYYGIEYLIEAFEIVVYKLKDKKLKLVIVGAGAIEQKILNMIKLKNLENQILLTGKIDYSQIHYYHSLLDIFVAVSVYQESFGVAVIEASACGKPVIISRVGGMIEVVDENLTGYIVPPQNIDELADRIIKLVLDPELRLKMGQAGREKVINEYSLNSSIDKMMKIYNELFKEKKRSKIA